jgi:hypothetical protein
MAPTAVFRGGAFRLRVLCELCVKKNISHHPDLATSSRCSRLPRVLGSAWFFFCLDWFARSCNRKSIRAKSDRSDSPLRLVAQRRRPRKPRHLPPRRISRRPLRHRPLGKLHRRHSRPPPRPTNAPSRPIPPLVTPGSSCRGAACCAPNAQALTLTTMPFRAQRGICFFFPRAAISTSTTQNLRHRGCPGS